MKEMARELCPPLVWRALRSLRHKPPEPAPVIVEAPRIGHFGRYHSFAQAMDGASNYQDDCILEVTEENTRRAGSDSSLSPLDASLLAALLLALSGRKARILDFGGALGGHYFSMRRFIGRIQSWTVVELPETVARGNAVFEDGVLRFTEVLQPADVVIASGVLQCVPTPYETLSTLKELAPSLIIDKVPLIDEDRLTMHHVPPALFGREVKIPSWFFGRAHFLRAIGTPKMQWRLPNYATMLDGQRTDEYEGFLV